MKKVFIISAILLLVASVFFGIYFFAFREKTDESLFDRQSPSITSETSQAPAAQAGSGSISVLIEKPIIAPVLTGGGNRIRYFDKATGNIEEADLFGTNRQKLVENDTADIGTVRWSPDQTKALVQSSADGTYFVYDVVARSKRPFRSGVDDAVWAGVANRVLYKYFDEATKTRSLNIADDSGENWKELAKIPWRDAKFAPIPQSSLAALWNAPDAFTESSLLTTSMVSGGQPQKIFSGSFGGDFLFSPNGNIILVSVSDAQGGKKVSLATTNASGGSFNNLLIPTIIEKALWAPDNTTIYYALPGEIPEGSVMPNAYRNGAFQSSDTFWKVNIASGKKERLIPLDKIPQKYDAVNLLLPPIENALLFLNRVDGQLYRLEF